MPVPATIRCALLSGCFFVVASPADAQDLGSDASIRQALDKARPALMHHLRSQIDGRGGQPGQLALLCLAALHDGVSPSDDVMAKALERLVDANMSQTYELALRLIVMENWTGYPDRKKAAERDSKALLKHRRDGAFSYFDDPAEWDLSNTQYGALGLRAAASMEVPIERKAWQLLADTVGDFQESYGGFGYRPGQGKAKGAYPSMTVAGIAVLAMCRQALSTKNASMPELDSRIKKGWSWMAKNSAAIGDTEQIWSYYFHYGLERAAILCDVEKVGEPAEIKKGGGVDWYRTGAAMLVREQQPGGGWISSTDHGGGGEPREERGGRGRNAGMGRPNDTAFAILFLRRGFRKVPGAVTVRVPMLINLTAQSSPDDVSKCGEALGMRGKAAMPEVLTALRDELPQRRRAAAIALQAISGQGFGLDAARTPAENEEALRRAELWYLKNR
jgi:hypothetical protein